MSDSANAVKALRGTPQYLSERTTQAHLKARGLARAGFTQQTIADHTGLTRCQVAGELHRCGISTMDYRRGESELARRVIGVVDQASKEYFNTIVSTVRRYLKD